MLKQLVEGKQLQANAVFGFWETNSIDPDTLSVKDEAGKEISRLYHLRQQQDKNAPTETLFSLADFIAPEDSGKKDYIGGFVVTAGLGAEDLAKEYEQKGDDYSAIMVKALADRLAEAFAEHLHERVRKEFWGYASDESLDNEALIKEQYKGIRPAPGYPACPDHTEKTQLFELLDATKETTVSLTEHFAMYPAAAVSGWYFSHPEAKYFGIGKIGRDQLEVIAERKGWDIKTAEKWLQPLLGWFSCDWLGVAFAALFCAY